LSRTNALAARAAGPQADLMHASKAGIRLQFGPKITLAGEGAAAYLRIASFLTMSLLVRSANSAL
jgi:hypothetical protein